jgi:hypothetical protein
MILVALGSSFISSNAQSTIGANQLQGIQDRGVQEVFIKNTRPKPIQANGASLNTTGLTPRQRVFVELDKETELGAEQVEVNNDAIFLRQNQSIGDGKIEVFPVQR